MLASSSPETTQVSHALSCPGICLLEGDPIPSRYFGMKDCVMKMGVESGGTGARPRSRKISGGRPSAEMMIFQHLFS